MSFPFPFLHRQSPSTVRVDHPLVDIRLFANESVSAEFDAFEQLFEFVDVVRAIEEVRERDAHAKDPFFGDAAPAIERIVLTPDFHKGSGIPVGTVVQARNVVIPQAIGNDVCCGMRLLATDSPGRVPRAPLARDPETPPRDLLRRRARHPDVPAAARGGPPPRPAGPRGHFGRQLGARDLATLRSEVATGRRPPRARRRDPADEEALRVRRFHPLVGERRRPRPADWVRRRRQPLRRDPAHRRTLRGPRSARVEPRPRQRRHHGALRLRRDWSRRRRALHGLRAREIFPSGVTSPKGGFFPLPTEGPRREEGLFYLDGMGNAANFAFANRLFLGLMALRAIEEATGFRVDARLVYDAPHNLVFKNGESCLHRKGATPAHGPSDDASSQWLGKPVIIPGSMGAPSYLLVGEENDEALSSACHGAGRSLSRGKASMFRARSTSIPSSAFASSDPSIRNRR